MMIGEKPSCTIDQASATRKVTAVTPKSLSRKIKGLRVSAPITASYERALMTRGVWSNQGVWYITQKEHWLGWLSQYDGPGAYGRKTRSGRSAEFVYNHINCPPMLLVGGSGRGIETKCPRRKAICACSPTKPRDPLCGDTKGHPLADDRGTALGSRRCPKSFI